VSGIKATVRQGSDFLKFIRFSHTVFALPFALGSMFVAAQGIPSLRVLGLAVLAMVFARTSAMSFNRIVDWEIDKRNPRTEGRHRLVSKRFAIIACVVSAALFSVTCGFLNLLCMILAPVALIIVFFYSFTKRFTHFAQFFLGLALAVAPVGGWLAVTGSFALPPLVLASAVLCWVAGFDMVYAMQDYDVDRREGLHSMVVALGIPGARTAAVVLHLAALAGLISFGITAQLGSIYFGALAGIALLLVWEHRLAGKADTRALNTAFFQANAAVGLLFVVSTLADVLIP
jgi:4-hydroxybenzoate polyprenyltransferase